MQITLTTQEEVMFFDTDCGQVVHNLAYLRMIETCRTKLASQLGMDLVSMSETKEFPVLVKTEIDYIKPGKLGDTLNINGKLTEVGRVKFWFEFEVRNKVTDQLLITCRQCLALVKMPEGKPLRVPQYLRDIPL